MYFVQQRKGRGRIPLVFSCEALAEERKDFMDKYVQKSDESNLIPNADKLKVILSKEMIKKTGTLVESLFATRRAILYKVS